MPFDLWNCPYLQTEGGHFRGLTPPPQLEHRANAAANNRSPSPPHLPVDVVSALAATWTSVCLFSAACLLASCLALRPRPPGRSRRSRRLSPPSSRSFQTYVRLAAEGPAPSCFRGVIQTAGNVCFPPSFFLSVRLSGRPAILVRAPRLAVDCTGGSGRRGGAAARADRKHCDGPTNTDPRLVVLWSYSNKPRHELGGGTTDSTQRSKTQHRMCQPNSAPSRDSSTRPLEVN